MLRGYVLPKGECCENNWCKPSQASTTSVRDFIKQVRIIRREVTGCTIFNRLSPQAQQIKLSFQSLLKNSAMHLLRLYWNPERANKISFLHAGEPLYMTLANEPCALYPYFIRWTTHYLIQLGQQQYQKMSRFAKYFSFFYFASFFDFHIEKRRSGSVWRWQAWKRNSSFVVSRYLHNRLQ